jgi:hypothetical protein
MSRGDRPRRPFSMGTGPRATINKASAPRRGGIDRPRGRSTAPAVSPQAASRGLLWRVNLGDTRLILIVARQAPPGQGPARGRRQGPKPCNAQAVPAGCRRPVGGSGVALARPPSRLPAFIRILLVVRHVGAATRAPRDTTMPRRDGRAPCDAVALGRRVGEKVAAKCRSRWRPPPAARMRPSPPQKPS